MPINADGLHAGRHVPAPTRMPQCGSLVTALAASSALSQHVAGCVLAPSDDKWRVIIGAANRHRLPFIGFDVFAAAGGLITYFADAVVDLHVRATAYVDRIFKGEKLAELPVQAPTKYKLWINLRTAKALGLSVPDKLLVAADEVIGIGLTVPARGLI